ncbi:MAG: hypothetical protein NTY90_04460 [Candidatus Micrarchaeota archaeon]|nr:hypothetical protein [Candidatus Micrarchaeota archaeon]
MKTPVCEIDAKSGFLCPACQDRLSRGELTEADVEVSRILHKYLEQFSLGAVEVGKAIDCGKTLVILTESDAGLLIGRGGKVASVIAKDYGKPVKIIQRTADLRKMVEELILPVRVLGINEVFKGGEKAWRVRIKRSDALRLPMQLSSIEKVLAQLTDQKTTIAFE